MLGAAPYIAVLKRESELERLTEAVRQVEAELDAALRLSDVKAAAKRLQRAKAELGAAKEAQPVSEPARTLSPRLPREVFWTLIDLDQFGERPPRHDWSL